MTVELPPSRFKTTGSLASLRWLMGWQAPGLACKVKSEAASLANMRLGDFVFFVTYALAGLVPPLSSFFLTLLEYYGLQLHHLSPNSIALVVIFVHLCEMYVGVRPSVRLFRCFFVLKAVSTHPPLIGGHYFQRRTSGHTRYIAHVFPWQVGTVERRLGAGPGECPRPAYTFRRWPDRRPHQVGEGSHPGARLRPRAGSNPVPSRKWPNFADGAARLPVKVPRASLGPVPSPRMDVHRGE
jgi:hypothetical protein